LIDYVATLQPGQQIDLVVVHRLALAGRPGQSSTVPQAVGTVGVESSCQRPLWSPDQLLVLATPIVTDAF
jgi:hypothetical protein